MSDLDFAKTIANLSDFSKRKKNASTNLHVISGEVVESSENGSVEVSIDGLVFSENDSQSIPIDTLGGLREGDIATILLAGEEGKGMTPLAIGGVGTIDRIEAEYAKIEYLDANFAHITEGVIDNATIDQADVNNLSANYAHISNGEIDNANIDQANVNNLSANYAHIVNGVIDNAEIHGTDIVDGTITGAQIASSTITGSNLVNGTITATQIANSTITGSKIKNGTIEAADIKDGTITGTKIAGATITGSNMVNGTITGTQIAESTITNSNLVDGTITGAKIQNGTIEAADIKDGTITGTKIASSTITNSNIVDGTITGAKIQGSTLTDIPYAEIDALKAANVTAQQIAAATGYVGTLTSNSVTASNLVADHATVGAISTTYATIDNLTAATGRISDLEADHVTVQAFEAEQGYIDALQAATADIATIRANSAKVANLTAAELEADHATIGSLDSNYAQINMANVNNAWIANGTIKDAAIKSEMVDSLSANKLSAGTINGNTITVTNLNADNITAGTLNGQRLGAGSISLSKLEDEVYTKTEVDNIASDLQDEIDGAIETWTGTAVPTLQNTPAVNWTTDSDKDKHVGDVYFVVNSQSQQNGYNYRFSKINNVYSWELIKDTDITNALQRLSTAEGQITTFDSDISTLKTDTGSLKTRATNLETRMTTAEGNINTKVSTQTFNELSSTVDTNSATITTLSETTTQLRADLDGIEIGGRNLLLLTSSSATGTIASGATDAYTPTYNQSAYLSSQTLIAAETVMCISFDWEFSGDSSDSAYFYPQFRGSAPSTANIIATCSNSTNNPARYYPKGETSGHYWIVFKVSSGQANPTASNLTKNRARMFAAVGATLAVSHFKLEFGNKPTNWTPAPEDLEGTVTTISNTVNSVSQTATTNSSIISNLTTTLATNADGTTKAEDIVHRTSALEQDLTGFKSTVSSTYATQTALSTAQSTLQNNIDAKASSSDLTALTTRVSTAESTIEQHDSSIALKANSSDVYTKTESNGLISTEVTNRNAAIEAATDAINLSVSQTYSTKTEAKNLVQPNLTPFFATDLNDKYNATTNPGGFWYSTSAYEAGYITKLADGWVHAERDNTGGSSNVYITLYPSSVWQQANAPIKVGGTYTVLAEVRNLVTGSDSYLSLVSSSTSAPKGMFASVVGGTAYGKLSTIINGELRGTVTARSDFSDCITTTRSLIGIVAGESVSLDLRISIYEGDYTGPFKPYVDTALRSYANAQLKIQANAIEARVEKDGVIAAINASVEESGGSAVKIQADKVNIEGAAIFTSGRLSQTSLDGAYDASGAAAAALTSAQGYADSAVSAIDIGGRNLLKNSAALTDAWAKENATVTDGVATITKASSGNSRIYQMPANGYWGSWVVGETYTVSVDAKGATSGCTLRMTPTNTSAGLKDFTLTTEWTRCSFTFSVTTASTSSMSISNAGSTDSVIQVRNPKLERGTKPTDWTPAPEDVRADISAVQSNVDAIDIGGRNLLCGTKDAITIPAASSKTVLLSGWAKMNVLATDTLTISFDAVAESNCYMDCYYRDESTSYNHTSNFYPLFQLTTSVQHFTATDVSGQDLAQMLSLRIRTNDNPHDVASGGAAATITNLKLEKGNKATDWTPAPEDVAADISTAQTTADNAAPKSSAVARTQRIYYRATATTTLTGPTTWLSTSGTGYGNWSLSVPPLTPTDSTTKYPYLYTATQTQTVAQQAAGSTCTCSPVLIDDTATVIDGGTIITGSVNANAVNASSGTFDTANIPNLNANKITAGDISADRIKTNVISAINSLTAGTIDAARINASQLVIGQSQIQPFFQGKENSTGYIHLGHVPYAVSSNSNSSHLHLTGRIGGWVSNNSGSIDVTFKSRDSSATYNTVDRKDDTIDTSFVDILVYTGTDTYTHYWLKVSSYWYVQLYAEYSQFVEDDHALTTTQPTGTCVWKLSEKTSVLDNVANQIVSRGEQLVINGNGFMGDNTNFSTLIFDGSVSNMSPGSFTKNPSTASTIVSDEMFPVDASKQYLVEFDVKSEEPGAKMYAMLTFYDVDKRTINIQHVSCFPDTTTTLARELKNGDTVIYLASTENWHATTSNLGHRRSVIIWDYTNSFGYAYPPETYSRNYYNNLYDDDSAVDKTNNTIALKSAWTGGTHAAGTHISQGSSGNSYNYFWYITNQATFPREWMHVSNTYTGVAQPTNAAPTPSTTAAPGFWAGTAYCKIGWLWNYQVSSSDPQGRIWVTNISVKENTASALDAVARTQRIYYRKTSSGAPSVLTAWLATSGTGYGNWSLKVPQLTSGSTKYPYLYTAIQTQTVAQQAAGNNCSCSTVLLDDSTTVIDGGTIITGSVTANQLDADSVKTNIVQATDLSADRITSGTISADRIGANSITAAKINSTNLHVSAANIDGTLTFGQIDNLETTLNGKATSDALTTEINQRKAQYGTCDTGATTAAKVVTCSNFELVAGNELTVKFTYANTSAAKVQLNVNSKGAKDIWVANAVTAAANQLLWGAGAYITFRYDGTQFVVIGEPRTWYGASTTAAATAAKTDTTVATGCVVCKGAKVELAMTNQNTASSPTLNIAGTGAKNLYFGNGTTRPTQSGGTSWLAGNTATFTFDGQYWRTAGKTYIDANSIVTGYISADRIEAGSLTIGKVDGLETTLGNKANNSDIPTDLSDLTNNAGYATTTDVADAVDAIDIGGRNLLRYVVKNYAVDDTSSTIVVSTAYRGMYCPVTAGVTYTISRKNVEGNRFRLYWTTEEPASGILVTRAASYNDSALVYTLTVPSGKNWLFIYLSNQSDVINDGNIKVERGNKATDWTPAPEDVEASVSAVQDNLDNLSIGGRNLLALCNAGLPKTTKGITVEDAGDGWLYVHGTITGTSNSGWAIFGVSGDAQWIAVNDTYTLTVENDGLLLSNVIRAQFRYSNNGSLEAKYFSDSGSVTQEINGFISRVGFYISGSATDTVLDGRVRMTLVKGTKSTDWTPAPEDVEADATAKADAVQANLDASRSWYATCPTIAATATKVATITPATTAFTTDLLTPGTTVYVSFSETNSATASSLKLSVNGTAAKPIKYIASGGNVANIPGNGYLIAGRTYEFYYDGTNWVVQMPYNTNNYDRENYKISVAASTTITAHQIGVFGTDGKLKVLSNTAFDMSKPILYVGTAYSADDVTNATTRTSNYTFWGSAFTLTDTHAITGAAAGKAVYIVGTVSGTTFTPNSTVLTCTVPTSADSLVYMRLGLMNSATAAFLESDHPLYMYFDGVFQQCDPAAASYASGFLTSITNGGLMVHRRTDSTTGVQVTDKVDILQSGDSVAQYGATARIGKAASSRFLMNASSLQAYDSSNNKYFEVSTSGMTFGSNTVAKTSDIPTTVAELTDSSSYLTTTDASSTYLTQSNASNTYLTQTNASNTYATQNNLTTETNQRKAKYGTCNTTASTQEKAVTCSNFELVEGNEITVYFSTANTYAGLVKLNVNSKGAKDIWVANAVTAAANVLVWGAGAYITFRYDGAKFVVIGEPRTWYGASTAAASTVNKTDDATAVSGCVICKGTKVNLQMSYSNTVATPKLNIQSTGNWGIKTGANANMAANGPYNWPAGSNVEFTFVGNAWMVTNVNPLKYLTHVDDNGITIHPSSTTNNRVAIDGNGMEVFKGNTSVAQYGDTARIGKASENHIVIDSDSVDFSNGALTDPMFKIQAYRDANSRTNVAALIDGYRTYEPEWIGTDTHPTGLIVENLFTDYYPDTFDGLYYSHLRLSAAGNLEQLEGTGFEKNLTADIHLHGYGYGEDETVDYQRTSKIDIQAKEVVFQDPSDSSKTLQLGKLTSGNDRSVYNSASVSVASSSWVPVTSIQIPSTGTWLIVMTGDFASNATGRRLVTCGRNTPPSSAPDFSNQNGVTFAPPNGTAAKFSSSCVADFDEDDVYYASAWQNSGSSLTTRIMLKAVRLI